MNKIMMNYVLAALVSLLAIGESFSAEGTWTAGVVGTTTYQQDWAPIALPWVSYRTDSYSINPMAASFIGESGPLHWQAGLGLDYAELFNNTNRSFLANTDAQYYWGPLRFTGSVSSRLVELLESWQWNVSVGSQLPIGPGMFGAEVGAHLETEQWSAEAIEGSVGVLPTAGLQYEIHVGDWQSMLLAQFQGVSSESAESLTQTYTFLLMKTW